jgi:hypothetical protein
VPDSLPMDCARHNDLECHWGYREGSATPFISCTLISDSNRRNVNIYHGSDAFKAEQMGRILDVKIPPFELCRVEGNSPHFTIWQPGEWTQLGLRVMREHDLVFQMNGVIIPTPSVTSWWIQYDFEAIMRCGNSVNSSIPPDPSEAEFPPFPWGNRVVVRIK